MVLARQAAVGGRSSEAILSSLGYGFEDLVAPVATGDPRYAAAVRDAERIARIAKAYRPAALELTSDEWEHASALAFLARRGATDEYLALLDRLRVRSSMSVARHFWYASGLRELAEEHAPGRALDVVEIGAGAGNLAVFLETLSLVRSYVIVDLPELLVHSAYTLTKYLPDADLRFAAPDGSARSSTRFSLLTPQQASLLRDDCADLCLNFDSLMEMDRDARDGDLEPSIASDGRSRCSSTSTAASGRCRDATEPPSTTTRSCIPTAPTTKCCRGRRMSFRR